MEPTETTVITATAEPMATAETTATKARRSIDPRWGVVLVAVLALATAFWPHAKSGAEPAAIEGGFVLDGGGRPIPLARELKPVTLVHFWATWCPPCMDELPKLVAFADGISDDRFGLVLVAVADQPDTAKKFLGSERFPLLFDPSWEVAHRFATEKLPETHLLVKGEVVESFIGASDWTAGDLQKRVLRYLSGRT
jgi:cytochrome c biogenesis protein CcmG/thiol:disulfide interchange protein DsbE